MCATEEDEPPRAPRVGVVPAEDRFSKTFTLGRGGAHKSSRCSPTVSEEGQRTETNGHGSPHAGIIDHEGVDETVTLIYTFGGKESYDATHHKKSPSEMFKKKRPFVVPVYPSLFLCVSC